MSIKERIIEESSAMFATYGLKSVRMDDIATSLGVSKRTIYELFGDKENLIESSVKHFFEKKNEEDNHRAAEAQNVIEQLLINMSASEEAIQKSINLSNDLKKFYPKIYRRLKEESYEVSTREMRKLIDRGISEGFFVRHIDPELPISLFIDLMNTVINRLDAPSVTKGFSIPETMRFCVIFFVRGIATVKGIEEIDKVLNKKFLRVI